MDIISKNKRSKMMSSIKNKGTCPEIAVRKKLFHCGYRYRKNMKVEGFYPDIILPGRKIAIFVHGCFWHQHEGCKLAYFPKSNIEKWKNKFKLNKTRDFNAHMTLKVSGWRIATIWECATRNEKILKFTISELCKWIEGELDEFDSSEILEV
ncbi:MAG: DNA mismatch endonuclease Vsr [gamma proteobacterium symbiont of Taylorina sp.]|nr:DNA mismatch endonuclease Vsr [gamma proteobacterium symbiont of Taylorina sp.]